jgi:hypothetical protein
MGVPTAQMKGPDGRVVRRVVEPHSQGTLDPRSSKKGAPVPIFLKPREHTGGRITHCRAEARRRRKRQ